MVKVLIVIAVVVVVVVAVGGKPYCEMLISHVFLYVSIMVFPDEVHSLRRSSEDQHAV